MLCVHCGAINPKDAKICTSCGRDIYEFGGKPPGETVENIDNSFHYTNDLNQELSISDAFITMEPHAPSSGNRGKFVRSMMLMSLVITLIIMIPMFFMSGSTKKSSLSDKADSGFPVNNMLPNGVSQENDVAGDVQPDEVRRSEQMEGRLVVPSNGSLIIATDAAKKARAMQIKSALHVYYAENDHFPDSLDDLDPNMINKKPEDWLIYTTEGNPPTYFELEFKLANENDSDPNKIVEDGIAKYKLASEYR